MRGPAAVAAAIAVTGGIVWGALWYTSPSRTGEPAPPTLAALVATLDPDLFTGKAREAYQAAKDIPEILQQMPCFCGCLSHFGHKNNLYCFHDRHGNECDECMNIALIARDEHRKGTAVDQIAKMIRAKYGDEPSESH